MAVQTVADGKFTYLAQKLNPAAATITVTSNLWVTAWSIFIQNDLQTEWIRFTSNTASGSYWVLWGLTRDIDQVAIPIVSNSTGKTWLANQKCLLVYMHDQYFDASQGGTISWPTIFSGAVSLTGSFTVPTFLNAAARDVAIPVPANGMEAYLITEWYFSDYAAGMWGQRSTGTSTINASTSVAGKVQIAVQSDVDTFNDTWSTWAIVSVPASLLSTVWSTQYVAWESITRWTPVAVEYFWNIWLMNNSSQDVWNIVANTRIYQQILWSWISMTTLTTTSVKVWAPVDNWTLTIETDSSWVPSGTLANANATATISWASFWSGTDNTWTFAWAFTLTLWTKYHVVIKRTTAVDVANYVTFNIKSKNNRLQWKWLYNGTYQTATFTTPLAIYSVGILDKYLIKASAAFTETSKCIWFASDTVSAWQNLLISNNGYTSGLTDWRYYYLSDTAGTVSLTAGTIKSVVWFSKWTTNLFFWSTIFNPLGADTTTLNIWGFSVANATSVKDYIFSDYWKLVIVASWACLFGYKTDWVVTQVLAGAATYTITFEPNKVYTLSFVWTAWTWTFTLARTYPFNHANLIY